MWNHPLSNYNIIEIVNGCKPLRRIFAGVFSLDELPSRKSPSSSQDECAIINLSRLDETGTHWVAYYKPKGQTAYYFDSFGNLQPPLEICSYLREFDLFYNRERQQSFNSVICGQLCLCFLYNAIVHNVL